MVVLKSNNSKVQEKIIYKIMGNNKLTIVIPKMSQIITTKY